MVDASHTKQDIAIAMPTLLIIQSLQKKA